MTERAQRDSALDDERHPGRTASARSAESPGKAWQAGRPLSRGGLLHLQRTAGNRAVSRLVEQSAVTVQRWPQITDDEDRTFTYSLGGGFKAKHLAADLDAAERKARRLYDPHNAHNTAVTVIVESSLDKVEYGVNATVRRPYDWSLNIDVEGAMMAPRNVVGANGDPGQLEYVDSVVVSGYDDVDDDGVVVGGKITHVSASQ